MTEQGTVVEVLDGKATVALKRRQECARCCASHFCAPTEGELRHFELENAAGAHAGDVVEIRLQARNVLASATLVYIAPLVALLAGYAVGKALSGSDHLGIAASLGGLALWYLTLKAVDRRMAKSARWRPVIARVVAAKRTPEH